MSSQKNTRSVIPPKKVGTWDFMLVASTIPSTTTTIKTIGAPTIIKAEEMTTTGSYHFKVIAKADIAQALGPEMKLFIDGETKHSTLVNTTTPQTFTPPCKKII